MLLTEFNATYTDLEIRSPGIFRLIEAGISYPATYYPVTIEIGGKSFEIFRLSIFDLTYDDVDNVIKVNSDEFEANKIFTWILFVLAWLI